MKRIDKEVGASVLEYLKMKLFLKMKLEVRRVVDLELIYHEAISKNIPTLETLKKVIEEEIVELEKI